MYCCIVDTSENSYESINLYFTSESDFRSQFERKSKEKGELVTTSSPHPPFVFNISRARLTLSD